MQTNTVPRRKRYSSYELSLRDLDEGRVTTHASVDKVFQKFRSLMAYTNFPHFYTLQL